MGFRSLRKQLPPPVPSEQPARKWSTSCFSPPYRKARLLQPMCVFNQPLRLTLPSQLPVSRVLSAPIGDSLGLSAWRAMPMPKPLPLFRSRCSGCRLSWLLSSIYQPSEIMGHPTEVVYSSAWLWNLGMSSACYAMTPITSTFPETPSKTICPWWRTGCEVGVTPAGLGGPPSTRKLP
jgi:hypothetical protein